MDIENGHMDGIRVTTCTRCSDLVDARSQIVNGVGPEDAPVLIIGEAPGADEDRQGVPFVGRSGAVLDEKLRAVGIDRDAVRITNCVRCRPPQNRNPTKPELSNCRPWLESEIERVDPEIIVTVGKVPSEHVLNRSVAVTTEAGTVIDHPIAGVTRRVLVCVHPAAILYNRSLEATLDRTLGNVATILGVDADGDDQSQLGDY